MTLPASSEEPVDEPKARSTTGSMIVWTSIANVALPLSAAITGPILARTLGVQGRGELAAVLAPLALVALLMSLGIPEALTYSVAARRTPIRDAVGTGCVLGLAAGLLGGGLVAGFSPLLLHRVPHDIPLLLALCVTVPAEMTMSAIRAIAQGRRRFDLVIRERWTSVLTRVALIGALAIAGLLTVTSAAWVTELTALAATLALLGVARRTGRPRFDRALAGELVHYASRAWTGTLSGVLILRLDQVLLIPLAGPMQLGYYAVAVSLAEIPAVAHFAVRDVIFSTSANRADPALAARGARMLTLVQLPLCIIGVAVAPWVIRLLFGDAFAPATPMARILFVASIPGGLGVVLGAGLLGVGRPGARSIGQLAGAGMTVLALVILVPLLGGVGAAWASLVAYTVTAAVLAVAMWRITGISLASMLIPTAADARDLARRFRNRLSRRRRGRTR